MYINMQFSVLKCFGKFVLSRCIILCLLSKSWSRNATQIPVLTSCNELCFTCKKHQLSLEQFRNDPKSAFLEF